MVHSLVVLKKLVVGMQVYCHCFLSSGKYLISVAVGFDLSATLGCEKFKQGQGKLEIIAFKDCVALLFHLI